jgi:hypothetical protein
MGDRHAAKSVFSKFFLQLASGSAASAWRTA